MINFNIENTLSQKAKDISTKDILVYAAIGIIALLSFGQTAVDFAYNNDGIGRILRGGTGSIFKTAPYLSGFTKGRWAYPFFLGLYNGTISIPYLATFISIALLLISSFIIWKIFDIKNSLHKITTGGLLCSSPIFVHYFFYSGDAEVYATGILLVTAGHYYFLSKSKLLNTLGVLLTVIALACYPALFAYSTTLIGLYSFLHFFQSTSIKSLYLFLFKLLFLSTISLLSYFAITKAGVHFFDLKMTSYKNASTISPLTIIKNLPEKIALTFSLFSAFLEKSNLVINNIIFISSILLILKAAKHDIKKVPFIVLNLLIIVPLVFVMHLLTYEERLYEGFQFGIIPLLSLISVALIRDSKWVNNTIIILSFLVIFSNIKNSNQIVTKYRLNVESSRMLSFNIINDIQKHAEFNSTKPIALIGSIRDNDNFKQSEVVPHTKVLNSMYYPVSFTEGTSTWARFRNQVQLQGFKFNFIDGKETEQINEIYRTKELPEYPKEGSIFTHKDIIVVNIGQK